jgi:tetratricopeptide (TPR) repeat protein
MVRSLLAIGALLAAGSWEVSPSGEPEDPRLPALLDVLEKATPIALRGLDERLGISPGRPSIRWRLDLCLPERSRENRSGGDIEAGRTAFEGDAVVVALPGRKYLQRPGWAAPVALHEAAHAVMASAAGSLRNYESIPGWFREGIALWFSGEGPARVREAIAWSVFQGHRADAFLGSIDLSAGQGASRVTAATAAEAFLLVTWLEGELGLDGLRALVRETVRGKPVPEILEAALQAPASRLREKALARSRAEVARIIDRETEDLFARALALRTRADPEASRIWADLLARDPRGPLAGTLLYLLGRSALEEEANPSRARSYLEAALDLPDALWRPESLVLLGECLHAAGDRREAERLWMDVARGWSEDAAPAARARANLSRPGAAR